MQPLFSPPLLVYMVWHPNCHQLDSVVEQIFDHFGTYRFQNVTGGAGIVYSDQSSHLIRFKVRTM